MGKLLERRAKAPAEEIPELYDGDTMNSQEFLRRYAASKTVHRAELLDGIVSVYSHRNPKTGGVIPMSPTASTWHGLPQMEMLYWLCHYTRKTPGTVGLPTVTVIFPSGKNTIDPDAILHLSEDCGGRARVNEDDLLEGIPELLVEVTQTSVKKDTIEKKNLYWNEGVQEYINYRKKKREIDWFVHSDQGYVPLAPAEGILKSTTFPGLWLDVEAFLQSDLEGIIDTLELGLASPEHAKFVEKLRRAKARRK